MLYSISRILKEIVFQISSLYVLSLLIYSDQPVSEYFIHFVHIYILYVKLIKIRISNAKIDMLIELINDAKLPKFLIKYNHILTKNYSK
jgi:hypothetical protein